jgi:hypothetical protein
MKLGDPISMSPPEARLAAETVIDTALRHFALRGSVLTQSTAGAAPRHTKPAAHDQYTCDDVKGLKVSPRCFAKMNLSKVGSETARRRRWFSFSSSFSRGN